MQVHVATVVKDEADRYWKSALEAWAEFADNILVLDDHSEDATMDIANQFEEVVEVEPLKDHDQMWGNEIHYRKVLFNFAMDVAEPGDIILWEDADMAPIKNPSEFFEIEDAEVFCFYLYDLWATDESHMIGQYGRERFDYRDEPPYWRAHEAPRSWAIRVPERGPEDGFDWGDGRGIHSGHIPAEFFFVDRKRLILPKEFAIAHWGYLDPADRPEKFERYSSVKDQLSDFEWRHARTIVDEEPRLRPLYTDVENVLKKP